MKESENEEGLDVVESDGVRMRKRKRMRRRVMRGERLPPFFCLSGLTMM